MLDLKKSELELLNVRCSIQIALLSEVPANLRGVAFELSDNTVHLKYFYDGATSADDLESMEIVETNLIASLPEDYTVSHEFQRWDYPKPLTVTLNWAYARREPLTTWKDRLAQFKRLVAYKMFKIRSGVESDRR